MKFIIAIKNLKFFALSMQFKDDATFKFNEFKQNVTSFNFICWSCKKLRYKIDNLMCFNYAFKKRDLQSWWKNEKRESLMFIVKSLNITMKRWLSHALMISILTNVSKKVHEAHCLIDFEIEQNFILQSWVKKHELSKNHATLKQIQTINDHWILCYDTHQIDIELIDHKKVCKSWNIEFHAVNM